MIRFAFVCETSSVDFDVGGWDVEHVADEFTQFIIGDFATAESDGDGLGSGQIASAERSGIAIRVQQNASGVWEIGESGWPIPSCAESVLPADDSAHQSQIALIEILAKLEPRSLTGASDVGRQSR